VCFCIVVRDMSFDSYDRRACFCGLIQELPCNVPHKLGWLKSTSGAAVWIGAIVACGLGRGRGRLWDVGRVKMVQRHSASVEE
jgi:hypothetical protein